MDFCPHCGAKLQDDAKRCHRCRKSVKKNRKCRSGSSKIEGGLWALPGAIALTIVIVSIVCTFIGAEIIPRLFVEETTYTETEYFACSMAGEKVYVDIVDIIPAVNLVSDGEIKNLLCTCTATNGETLTMYITVSDFADNFDSDIWTYLGEDYRREVRFSPKRVHGISVYHEDVVEHAPGDIAKTILLRFVSAD